jgi:hypothetical protein
MTTQHPTGKSAHLRNLAERYPDTSTDGGTPHPHRRRNRLILLAAVLAVSLAAAAGYEATAPQRTPPPPPPLVVAQPRSTPTLTDGTSCNILAPTELQALIGPPYDIGPNLDADICTYYGEDGRGATISFYSNLAEINPKDWSINVVGNSTQIRTLSGGNNISDDCTALVLLKLPPDDSSVLQISGDRGVTCDQVIAAAAAVIAHLPPP